MNDITEMCNELGRWLAGNLWRLSVELAVLATVVVAVIWLLRIRSPRVRHLFWCLVLAKPVVTLLVASPVSLYWYLQPVIEQAPSVASSEASALNHAEVAVPVARRWSYGPGEHAFGPAVAVAPAPVAESAVRLDAYGAGALVWIAGAGVLALRLVVGYCYVAFLRWTATLQRAGPAAEALSAATVRLGAGKGAKVASSQYASGPVLAGVLRPVILLPHRLSEQLSRRQMTMVVAHELAHLRRHDNLLLVIQRLAEMLLFFHPAVWLCGLAMRREAESACDDAVVTAFGGSASYADSLARVAETSIEPSRKLLVNTFAAGEGDFPRRVRRILSGRASKTTLALSIASVVALVIVGCLGLPTASERKVTAEPDVGEPEGKTMHAPAVSKAKVRREGRKVWIEGVKELFEKHFEDSKNGRTTPWAERSDTYMYLTQMRVAGWDVDYADLITIAGYGPSFAYAPRLSDSWGVHYHPPRNRDDRIAHGTGCVYRWRQYGDPEDYWQALKRAIDEGQVVHGPNEEDVLFIGYVDADRPADRKVLPLAIVFVEDDEWTWEQFTKWHSRSMVRGWFGRIEGAVDPWPRRKSAIEVLKLMVAAANGNDSRRDLGKGATWGIDGIEAYAADLADMSKSGAPEDEEGYFQGGWRGCHNIYPQMSGRPAAATYLKRISSEFDGKTKDHLLAAAARYEDATASWKQFDKHLGRPLGDKHGQAWQSKTSRQAGAKAVSEAAAHERKAVAEIEAALIVEGVTAPSPSDVVAAAGTAGEPVNEIAPDGMLRSWNVMSFPVNPQAIRNMPTEYFRTTFDKDYLAPFGGQAKARLAQGTSVEYVNETGDHTTVRAVPTSADSRGWMVSGWDQSKYGRRVVYAFCNVRSDKARKATWYFGCGDEANIWVNGKLAHETYSGRAYCEPRQDKFFADLKQGLNTVMVKASQRAMTWEFVLEVHPEGADHGAKEGALSASITSKATVKREGDKVWIEPVKGWSMGERGSSVHAAQAAILAAIGEDVTYTDLLGASALAFRMQVHKEMCPSSPHPYCGEQCITGSSRIFPLRARAFHVKPDDAKGVAAARKAVTESIDRGIPAQFGSEEDGIVVGYAKGGARWLVLHPFREGGKKVVSHDDWPWGVAVCDGRKMNMPSRHEVAVAAVLKAVLMARRPTDRKGEYYLGFRAWEFWLKTLQSLRDDDQAGLSKAMQGNHWIYCTLAEYRRVGAEYLRSVAQGFKPEAVEHINAAADIYAKMADEVLTDANHCSLTVAPHAQHVGGVAKWTQAMRDDQLRRMKAAVLLEKRAIAELAQALDAEGIALSAGGATPAQGGLPSASVAPMPSAVAGMVALSTPTTAELTHGQRWQVENVAIAIALRACMNVIGEDLGKEVKAGWSSDYAYQLCLSATGEAYGMMMQVPKTGGKMEMTYRRRPSAVDIEAYNRALEALGRTGKVLMRPDGSGGAGGFTEAGVRDEIIKAIEAGRPVIVQGLPSAGHYALVTGYANAGHALIGWSCEGGGPSILFEPDKRQQFTNWFPVIEGVVIIKGKAGGLDTRVHRRILTQAVDLLRRGESGEYFSGPALYEAWARQFDQGDSKADRDATLAHYNRWINPAIWDLAEKRHYAGVYLGRAATDLPKAAEYLNAAAAEFKAIHDLMWDISRTGGRRSAGAPLPWLTDSNVRKAIAKLIRKAARHDARAADYLADAVAILDGKAPKIQKIKETAPPAKPPQTPAATDQERTGPPLNELNTDGTLRHWNVIVLALGSEAVRNKPEEYFRAGFDKDYLAPLGGQARAELSAGTSVEYVDEAGSKAVAEVEPKSANSLGWLVSGWDSSKYGRRVVYAFCQINADKAQKAYCRFGSGDEANIWINGKLVHETYVARAYCAAGQDKFTTELKKGLNTVVVKASQRSVNWEFVLEVYPEDAAPEVFGLTESEMSIPRTRDKVSGVPS